jgi:hypothetical protein
LPAFQFFHFLRRESPVFSRHHVEFHRSVTNAFDFFHAMADLLEHSADLSIAALGQRDFVPGVIGFPDGKNAGGGCFHRTLSRIFAAQIDPIAQTLQRFGGRLTGDLNQICLGNV